MRYGTFFMVWSVDLTKGTVRWEDLGSETPPKVLRTSKNPVDQVTCMSNLLTYHSVSPLYPWVHVYTGQILTPKSLLLRSVSVRVCDLPLNLLKFFPWRMLVLCSSSTRPGSCRRDYYDGRTGHEPRPSPESLIGPSVRFRVPRDSSSGWTDLDSDHN